MNQEPAIDRDPRHGMAPPQDTPLQETPGRERELEPQADHGETSYIGSGKLAGLTALITGGDSGIGRAVAIAYAREGADVAIGYFNERERKDAEDTADWVRKAGRKVLTYALNVQRPEECEAFVSKILEWFGRLDIVVNNAAYQQEQTSLLDITPEQLESTFRTNIFGYFYIARASLPHLKAGAVILNCGSVVAMEGHASLLDYSATKGAIHTFTKALALQLAKDGIRVNCVAPGPVWTPYIPATMKAESVSGFGEDSIWHRPAQPAEIAPSFVFLASNDARYYTAEVLAPTGMGTTR
jgi:NAD(P)-dependent dehydrogenase (short-subunit alcohol dehydrogenase family)